MKRIKTLLLALAASFITATAQTDEITVHNDQNGRDEVIDLPEGMSVSCDSLINEWLRSTFILTRLVPILITILPSPPKSTKSACVAYPW